MWEFGEEPKSGLNLENSLSGLIKYVVDSCNIRCFQYLHRCQNLTLTIPLYALIMLHSLTFGRWHTELKRMHIRLHWTKTRLTDWLYLQL